MMRNAFAVWFLALSWLFSTGYYHAPNPLLAAGAMLAGALLFARRSGARTPPRVAVIAAALLVPAIIFLPWPYQAIPSALLAAVALTSLPFPVRWPGALGVGLGDAAIVLFAQGLALWAYAAATAREHNLPAPLGHALAGVARLLGLDAAYSGDALALGTIRKTHLLAPTWDLLADPVTVAVLAGGLALLARAGRFHRRPVLTLIATVLCWLPWRAGLLIGLFLQRALLTDYEHPFNLMNQFWNPWLLGALALPPALLSLRMLANSAPPVARLSRRGLAALAAGAALLTAAVLWTPIGQRQAGRVLVDEYHSTWEPTARPFDTEWYGQKAGYNYACLYDLASRYYAMGRITNRTDDAALAACDVLVLKVPNAAAYTPDEVRAVTRFVERGGGLMLIGEHTDVFNTGAHLNQVARQFGFEFRADCLFSIDTKFEQRVGPLRVPHPVLQHMPTIDMEVSCSIAPHGFGRAVIRSVGLWELPADYHASNYYPQLEDRADTRYGAFIQLWSTRRGHGRVLAFTDSTVFSNFSMFEPGKRELALGMLEWLNHRDRLPPLAPWLALAGLVSGLWGARRLGGRTPLLLALATILCAGSLTALAVRRHHATAMPPPPALRPFTEVVMDRTVSSAPLSRAGFIQSTEKGFGIFEQWILRLGFFTSRHAGADAFKGDLLIIAEPDGDVTDDYRRRLVDYVHAGGKVLVLDSARNAHTTANSLLYPFGLSQDLDSDASGSLTTVAAPTAWPAVDVARARKVQGGTVLASINGTPAIAAVRAERGLVVLASLGGRFNDDRMGVSTDLEPSPEQRAVFDLEFALLRDIVADRLLPPRP